MNPCISCSLAKSDKQFPVFIYTEGSVVLLPLFINAFRIAQDLSFAMEARCYHGGVGRTRMHEMKLKRLDYLALFLTVSFLIFIIVERTVL